VGEKVKAEHTPNVRVCAEQDVLAAMASGGVEIQVMQIGVAATSGKTGREEVVYMRLETPFTIPFENFKWESSSEELWNG
jgi:hypothetical protein